MTFSNDIARQIFENGEIKAQNKKQNKYIVKFHDGYFVFKDGAVVYQSIFLATAQRNYKRI